MFNRRAGLVRLPSTTASALWPRFAVAKTISSGTFQKRKSKHQPYSNHTLASLRVKKQAMLAGVVDIKRRAIDICRRQNLPGSSAVQQLRKRSALVVEENFIKLWHK